MARSILIALVAAAASALMFVSITSGAIVTLLLFYLAPLPLLAAAFGWGPGGALIGGLAASATIASLHGLTTSIGFLLTVALPAWWLPHLALLARSGADPFVLEWYPVGRLVLWMAACAAIMTLAALFTLGSDEAGIRDALQRGLTRILRAQGDGTSADSDSAVVAILARIAPPAATVIAMLTLAINVWLAARIVRVSGHLSRPWPDLRTLGYPAGTLLALGAALAASFLGGLTAMVGQLVSAVLLVAYVLAGLAVVHALTQNLAGRGLWLGLTYAMLTLFGWPAIVLLLLGLGDAVFGLRARYAPQPKPPTLIT